MPRNSAPWVAQCDVSEAEERLEELIGELNTKKHSMCTKGLDFGDERWLTAESTLRSSLPVRTVKYVKGEHKMLELHDRRLYTRPPP